MQSGRSVQLDDILLGKRLRARRLELKLSLAEAAHAAGTTFQQLQKYESGYNRVSASRLLALCKVLRSTPNVLLNYPAAKRDLDADDVSAWNILQTPEGCELAKLFSNIPQRATRRQIVELVRTLAEPQRPARSVSRRQKHKA